jgi:hypothetical protein
LEESLPVEESHKEEKVTGGKTRLFSRDQAPDVAKTVGAAREAVN